ncbi:HU family DNA-binding protein [Pseudodonghicola xiamenensis]|uniref:DNA-binding protein n=1 Tax=Pseudodonghicola xiamenensis TaxID=337702 RepID=A0A8J3H4U6_9RHOB|nr:HU family DNA-binding protein [Pseudodonghicola xiamenensis]GHG87044.1 hypothetical protein GCM10010961_15130 [Pseudodonghicola xiamenensis]
MDKSGKKAKRKKGAALPQDRSEEALISAEEAPGQVLVDIAEAPDADADTASDLSKKELIARVLARTDVKKRDAKPVIEAVLAVLGETLAEGRGANLAPLGKLSVNRTVERGDRRVMITKLRQKVTAAAPMDLDDSDGAPD